MLKHCRQVKVMVSCWNTLASFEFYELWTHFNDLVFMQEFNIFLGWFLAIAFGFARIMEFLYLIFNEILCDKSGTVFFYLFQ